jgi:hypothetical protein
LEESQLAKNKKEKINLKEWVSTHGTDFVIKTRDGKPYICRKPKRDPTRRKSPSEQKQVNIFKLAVEYAREVIADEEKKTAYREESEKSGRSIYHLAITDYIHKHRAQTPVKRLEFERIIAKKTGQHMFLKINLVEPAVFAAMEVSLLELDMSIVETGKAEQATVKSWWYLIKHPDIAGLPFRARVAAISPEEVIYEAEQIIV